MSTLVKYALCYKFWRATDSLMTINMRLVTRLQLYLIAIIVRTIRKFLYIVKTCISHMQQN